MPKFSQLLPLEAPSDHLLCHFGTSLLILENFLSFWSEEVTSNSSCIFPAPDLEPAIYLRSVGGCVVVHNWMTQLCLR